MDVEFALLADYAAVTNDGKLTAAGIFDRVTPPQLPWQHPTMFIALRVLVHPGEEGEHKVRIRLVDPDGTEIVALDADSAVPTVDPVEGARLQFVLALNNLVFPAAGRYGFDVFLDGRYEHSVPLVIVEPVTAPGGQEQLH